MDGEHRVTVVLDDGKALQYHFSGQDGTPRGAYGRKLADLCFAKWVNSEMCEFAIQLDDTQGLVNEYRKVA